METFVYIYTQRCRALGLGVGVALVVSQNALAHSWRQRASAYTDDQGVQRQRLKMDMSVDKDFSGSTLTAGNYAVSANYEAFTKDDISDDEYMQEVYGSDQRQTGSGALVATHTLAKLTDVRVLGSYTSDRVMRARTGGVGLSRWVFKENLQLSADVSRTLVESPVFETLGADSDVVAAPPVVTSTGTALGAKVLATPTTVTNVSWTHTEANNRPPANIYGIGVKQFITVTDSAVHFDAFRAVNRGRVTTATTYGEVDAWIGEAAFLQTLWRNASGRIGYRYYREDETTRVDQNEFVRGSDLVSIGLAQTLTQKDTDALRMPVVIEATAARYRTNELESGSRLAANIYELGMSARF